MESPRSDQEEARKYNEVNVLALISMQLLISGKSPVTSQIVDTEGSI
jgi:hypothetical protein